MKVQQGSARYDTERSQPSGVVARGRVTLHIYQMVLDAYLGTWAFRFISWRPHRSVSLSELELSMWVWSVPSEMSWLPVADPHGREFFIVSASSMSVCRQVFFPQHLYLDNWTKPLIGKADVSQTITRATLQITPHIYIWTKLTFGWLFNDYMGT